MNRILKYVPIFRGRQEELKVLKSFDFGDNIFPCIEIIKDFIRALPKTSKREQTFESEYLPLLKSINAKHVFVDLPIHLKRFRGMKDETLNFLLGVILKREMRTEYLKKLSLLSDKLIPVISSYSQITAERGSIIKQEKELRPDYKTLAFRTFMETFFNDIQQIEPLLKTTDFLIMDWGDRELDITDDDQNEIVEYLRDIKCTVIIHRNSIKSDITNTNLSHCNIVDAIDNSLLDKYKNFGGSCFSDYVGIKKDNITGGATISPGFVYYDAVNNEFYGYRYQYGGHKKGEIRPELEEYEITIIPAVILSDATKRMRKHHFDYLGNANLGWKIIQNIKNGEESGKSPAKFKRIGMEHYLHCIKTRIINKDLE